MLTAPHRTDTTGGVSAHSPELHDTARDYTDEQRAELGRLRAEVETIVGRDGAALG